MWREASSCARSHSPALRLPLPLAHAARRWQDTPGSEDPWNYQQADLTDAGEVFSSKRPTSAAVPCPLSAEPCR